MTPSQKRKKESVTHSNPSIIPLKVGRAGETEARSRMVSIHGCVCFFFSPVSSTRDSFIIGFGQRCIGVIRSNEQVDRYG